MVGGDARRVDLAAIGADRHEGRPTLAILFAQSSRDDASDLGLLRQNQPERLIKRAGAIHLASTPKLVLDLDRLQKFFEPRDHMLRIADAASERIGNPADRLADIKPNRL